MKRILLIDDEKRIGAMYSRLLSEEGFDVRWASNVRDATNFLIRESFDLVLLDINMPEIGGCIMYEIIREYDAHLKVIVSSVMPIHEQINKVLGACAYHDKAQGVDLLVNKVKEVLCYGGPRCSIQHGRRPMDVNHIMSSHHCGRILLAQGKRRRKHA